MCAIAAPRRSPPPPSVQCSPSSSLQFQAPTTSSCRCRRRFRFRLLHMPRTAGPPPAPKFLPGKGSAKGRGAAPEWRTPRTTAMQHVEGCMSVSQKEGSAAHVESQAPGPLGLSEYRGSREFNRSRQRWPAPEGRAPAPRRRPKADLRSRTHGAPEQCRAACNVSIPRERDHLQREQQNWRSRRTAVPSHSKHTQGPRCAERGPGEAQATGDM